MSRMRKQERDMNRRGAEMGLDLNGTVAKIVKEKVHTFHLQNDDGHVTALQVPHGKMKRCPCGSDRFEMQYHGTWGRAPGSVIGQPPIFFKVELFVCAACGLELAPTHSCVEDKKLEVG